VLDWCLRALGRHAAALEAIRVAEALSPDAPLIVVELAHGLEGVGRRDEAFAEFRKTVALGPELEHTRKNLRDVLLRLGRPVDARAAWEESLRRAPAGHDDWYGYAELCLFLADEDAYRSARTALLDRFSEATDVAVAERVARACLLRSSSGDELRRAVALGERAWNADPRMHLGFFPYFLFLQGLAEYRLDHFESAVKLMRGDASRVLGPAPRLVLALALHRTGPQAEARETLDATVAAYDWRASEAREQNAWIGHALRCEAEGLILGDSPSRPVNDLRPSPCPR
jgi:serine/threonine-protein kinase